MVRIEACDRLPHGGFEGGGRGLKASRQVGESSQFRFELVDECISVVLAKARREFAPLRSAPSTLMRYSAPSGRERRLRQHVRLPTRFAGSVSMATVLIVEDDYFLADELRQSLTEAGHKVVGTAPSFERAAEIAASSPPQVALVDYRLKGSRDGLAVAEHLRKLGTHIIYVTSEPDAVRLADGRAEIVPKPYDMNELVRAVAHVVQSAERDQ